MFRTTQWNVNPYMFGMSRKTYCLKLCLYNNENNVPVFCENMSYLTQNMNKLQIKHM